ncbi:uncharacterized protein C9orf50 homolog [Leptonychotes weddellii]|uniref:Uncharacterized protein C9orf50 homolog n=1 Tax=Leptonychotes weddellii TaxID=9713 RepID=A0A7F8Q6G2_LEPWE|nr:uncharacterized protein C9orf50 homolog [Leptonychotes weddellii]
MPRRPPNPGTQQVAPKGLPGDGARRRRDPRLPRLPLPQLRGSPGGLRASEGGGAWSPSPRLPALPTLAQRAAQNRTRLRSLLLLAGAPRELAPGRPGPGEREDPCRGAATLPALLGEFLPSRFRELLHQLGAERAEPPPPSEAPPGTPGGGLFPPPPGSQHPQHHNQKGVSEYCHHSPRCPQLPDLRGQSLYFQNSLKKILLHQIPALGTLRRDHSQFTLKKANHRPHGAQAPKLKAVLTHSSSGESSGQRRRFCPFRVRFADETLRDTALRYWERSCAAQPLHFSGASSPRASKSLHLFIDQLLCAVSGNVAVPKPSFRQGTIENGIAPRSTTSEGVFGSVGRWLESLSKALCPRAKEEAMANISFGWDCPGLPIQEPPGHLSEDASVKSSLPCIPRATTQRPRGDLQTLLDTDNILGQVGKSPCSWSRKLESFLPSLVLHTVLKRGCPKGYQPLLPSMTPQEAPK